MIYEKERKLNNLTRTGWKKKHTMKGHCQVYFPDPQENDPDQEAA